MALPVANMSGCKRSMQVAMCDAFRNISLWIVKPRAEDNIHLAEISLHASIDEIKAVETNSVTELHRLVGQVKQLDPKKQRASLHEVLRRSRVLRGTLESTRKKRSAMEQHLETLKQSQLNQSMMSSMKQTTDALQTLGLKIEDADSIMLDLEDNTHDLNAMQSTLGQNFTDYDFSADELESELELMLSEDALCPVAKAPAAHVAIPKLNPVVQVTEASTHQDNSVPPPGAAPMIEAGQVEQITIKADEQPEEVAA